MYTLNDLHILSHKLADKRLKKGSEKYNELLNKWASAYTKLGKFYGKTEISFYQTAIDKEIAKNY